MGTCSECLVDMVFAQEQSSHFGQLSFGFFYILNWPLLATFGNVINSLFAYKLEYLERNVMLTSKALFTFGL